MHDAAAGPVRRLPAGGRRHGHAALPQVHRRPLLGGRLRLAGQSGGVQGALRLFAVSQSQKGNEISGDAGDDGGHRRPRGAGPQLQVHRRAAVLPGRRCAGAGPHRDARRPRRRQADGQADRGSRRSVGVSGEESGHESAGKIDAEV